MNLNEIKKHKFIVIGYEHINPLGIIRSLAKSGIKPIVIILKGDIKIASKSRYIKRLYVIESNDEAVDICLKYYTNEEYKPFIIPCDDNSTETIDKNYDRLKNSFFIPNAQKQGRIFEYMDKLKISDLALKHNLNITKTWSVKRGEIPNDILYPIITKPLTSYPNWKKDYYICNNDEELNNAYSKIQNDSPLLLQFYLRKSRERCFCGVSVNHGKNIFFSMVAESNYVLPSYYSFEIKLKQPQLFVEFSKIKKMIEEVGYEGIFSVDFIDDQDGNSYFSEVNFRNSGYSWASTKAGYNLPILWAGAMLDNDILNNIEYRIPENFIALWESGDLSQRVIKNKMISLFTWFKGIIKADCLFLWDKKDLKPVFSYWFGVIMLVISKKIKGTK